MVPLVVSNTNVGANIAPSSVDIISIAFKKRLKYISDHSAVAIVRSYKI